MSRAAIYEALLADQQLIDLGFDSSSILVNYDGEQRPSDTMFIVLQWENDTSLNLPMIHAPVKSLTVWVHMYKSYSTDFVRIDSVIGIIDCILFNMIHVDGSDGMTLTLAELMSKSRDLRDDSYQTLCRSASYRILSRETASV